MSSESQMKQAITEVFSNEGFYIGTVYKVGKQYTVKLPTGQVLEAHSHNQAFGLVS